MRSITRRSQTSDDDSARQSTAFRWSGSKRRQRSFAEYQQVIRQAGNIGRALGDAFAWFFYQSLAELLRQHLKRPRISAVPTGIGGQGEVVFISATQDVEGSFVICHSITSLLRIGDISLIDVKTRNVVALGELKTTQDPDGSYDLHLSMIGDRRTYQPSDDCYGGGPPPRRDLPPDVGASLERQIPVMVQAVVAPAPEIRNAPSVRRSLVTHLLNYYATPFAFLVMANSILGGSVGATQRERSLGARLFGALRESDMDGAVHCAHMVIVSASNHNRLFLSTLVYGHDSWPVRPDGGIPLFWSDLPRSFSAGDRRRCINPTPLLHRLERDGWEIA